jgi:hypothetical protein
MAAPTTDTPTYTTGGGEGSPFNFVVDRSSVSDGDVLILVIGEDTTRTIDEVPADWVLIDSVVTGSNYLLYVYAKYVETAAGEPDNYTWSFNLATVSWTAIMFAVPGADIGHLDDIAANITSDTATGAGDGVINTPDVVVNENDSLILRFGFDGFNAPTLMTHPAGETPVAEDISNNLGIEVSKSTASAAPGVAEFLYEPDWHVSDALGGITIAIPPSGAPLAVTEDTFQNSAPFNNDESIGTVGATGGSEPYAWEVLSQDLT